MSFNPTRRQRIVLIWLAVPLVCALTGMAMSYLLVGDAWSFTWLALWLGVFWAASATALIYRRKAPRR
jgi:hypothetical protein